PVTWSYLDGANPRKHISVQPVIAADATGPGEAATIAPPEVACVLRNVGTFGIPGDTAETDALEVKATGARAEGRGGYNIPSLYGLALGRPREQPHPGRGGGREARGDHDAAGEAVAPGHARDHERRHELHPAGRIEHRPHGRRAQPRGEQLGEHRSEVGPRARPEADDPEAEEKERGPPLDGPPEERDRHQPGGHQQGVERERRLPTDPVRDEAEGRVPEQ